MSYVLALTACVVYFSLTFLLWMKAKWRKAAYYTPQPSLKLLTGGYALLAVYYFVWVLRAYFLVDRPCTVVEGMCRTVLTVLPVYCMVYAPLPVFRYKKHIRWLLCGLTILCMAGVVGGSLVAGTLHGWSSLMQKIASAMCLSALACGAIPFGVLYRSNDLAKKLYHNKTGGYRWVFLAFWSATCVVYLCLLLGRTLWLQGYVAFAMLVHVWMLLPVLRVARDGTVSAQAGLADEYSRAALFPHSSWAVLEEASRAVTRTEENLYDKLEVYMRREKPFLRPEISRSCVAAAIGTNATYLSRVINTRENTSFIQYVNKHRVYFAQEYYRTHSGVTLMDLCVESGFRSMAAFNISFRAYMGMTPGQWCKQLDV